MAIAATAVATSIAGYSVTGLTIKDLDGFKDEYAQRDCPILIPHPTYFTDPVVTYDSFGTGATALITVHYTLNYRMLYAMASTNRRLSDVYQSLVGLTVDFMDAIIANDATTDAYHLATISVGAFGVVVDPSDNPFFGVDIGIRVSEYEN
jgi:hypothetical protein